MSRNELSRRSFALALGSGLASTLPLVSCITGCTSQSARRHPRVRISDPRGVLQRTSAPVAVRLRLPDELRRAGAEGRLVALELSPEANGKLTIPVQLVSAPAGEETLVCWLMPPGEAAQRDFTFGTAGKSGLSMCATVMERQYEITQWRTPVLRYNYAKVEPGNLLQRIAEPNLKYAVARSDYIHPLYGPSGEELTKDWSVDHPHHRGIYWAWPEVDWQGRRGDLHALQKVFARPTGRCEAVSGPVFAEVAAENVWRWETGEEIVRERAVIRAYLSNTAGRFVDLQFQFEVLGEPVNVARRDTKHYGGLNVRLNSAKEQRITKHTSPPESAPRAAWSDLSGTFPEAAKTAGVSVLQHQGNPDYPSDWVDYPELNWVQPTFPASGTRYAIEKGRPLTLKFRLWVHSDGAVSESVGNDLWTAANGGVSPLSCC